MNPLTWLLDGDRPTYQLWLGIALGAAAAYFGMLLAWWREFHRRYPR